MCREVENVIVCMLLFAESSHYDILIAMYGRECILLEWNIRNGDFDGFKSFGVS